MRDLKYNDIIIYNWLKRNSWDSGVSSVHNNLDNIMNVIYDAPVWVQEVIYLDIKKHLDEKLAAIAQSNSSINYPVYVPELTFKGKQELKTHENNLDFNIYKYLKSVSEGLRVIDITLNNFWSLEESSYYLAECLKKEFIKPVQDIVLNASVFYLAGEIRIGEYVKRLNKINVQELDDVLRKQKVHNQDNPDAKIKVGQIMVDMGYVANNDIDKILYIKDEAKRRFIVSKDIKTTSPDINSENTEKLQQLTSLNQRLSAENKLLKDKLRAIFNIQNKNK